MADDTYGGGGYGLDLSGIWANMAAQNALNRDRYGLERDRYGNIDLPSWLWQKDISRMGLSGYYKLDADGNWVPAQPGDAGAVATMPTQQWLADLTGMYGGKPTMAREQWQTAAGGWMPGGEASFDRERYYGDLAARLSGPQDWVKYQAMMANAPKGSLGGLQDVFKRQSAWSEVGGSGRVTQPQSITANQLRNMTPTQRAMQSGEWESQGFDANDFWQRVQKAQPQGSASTWTKWR